ncbi:DUF1330 domain-containing protein [Sphingomonas sp.]|uniref:DUF1330 domain-containing protein n=1 Tax=Sphingomonas sp. TaxID=28214 RepID=UPI001B10982B|nr:DUF1330 domain-containing protein [Sphingomonas sp.]MBO9712756.1 DUF1330 domain-containing protein [Sphingomonas sp.]
MQRIGMAGLVAAAALTAGPAASGAGQAVGQATGPKGYVVAQLTVHDPAKFGQYAPQVPAILAKYGGHYIVRGGGITPVEGEAPSGRVVIIEFPSVEAARAFNASPDYLAIAPLRHASAEGPVFIVEGVPPK